MNGGNNPFRQKFTGWSVKQRDQYNLNAIETIYEDGVEVDRTNQGIHPSGRAYYTVDEKEIEKCLAWWTKPDVIMDSNMRRPDDPDYDKTTIHVPEEAWKSLSASMI